MKAAVTTHILDLQLGRPAAGVVVHLTGPDGTVLQGSTDTDGRIVQWSSPLTLTRGQWNLQFELESWLQEQQRPIFFPQVLLSFKVEALDEHYHVPLLLNTFGYSTYRGS